MADGDCKSPICERILSILARMIEEQHSAKVTYRTDKRKEGR